MKPTGPRAVWADVTPDEPAFDETVVAEWSENGVSFRALYVTGKMVDGDPVRIYAVYAVPDDVSTAPGMLHVHGGGQTVDEEWLRFWTDRGYAALSFDWHGVHPESPRVDREEYTKWRSLDHANQRVERDQVTADPRESGWYEWGTAAMRALSYLESRPAVDPDRLGAFGISMGGTIMWYLAGIDDRLAAGCAVYGAGWNTYDVPKHGDGADEPTETQRRWRETMAPEAYAPLVDCPMLFLSATNDFHGHMDRALDTLAAMPAPVERRQAFTPHATHHVAEEQARTLPLWMDRWLHGTGAVPPTPAADLATGEAGDPSLRVRPARAGAVGDVSAYYALENPHPETRFWRSVDGEWTRDAWRAPLPVADASSRLFAFANVRYENGACLSTRLCVARPTDLGPVTERVSPSRRVTGGESCGWTTDSPTTEPRPPIPDQIRVVGGPEGKRGVRPLSETLRTYRIGDPEWVAPPAATLAFDATTEREQRVSVVALCGTRYHTADRFETTVTLSAAGRWEATSVPASTLVEGETGEPLESWREADGLEFACEAWPDEYTAVRGLRWAR